MVLSLVVAAVGAAAVPAVVAEVELVRPPNSPMMDVKYHAADSDSDPGPGPGGLATVFESDTDSGHGLDLGLGFGFDPARSAWDAWEEVGSELTD